MVHPIEREDKVREPFFSGPHLPTLAPLQTPSTLSPMWGVLGTVQRLEKAANLYSAIREQDIEALNAEIKKLHEKEEVVFAEHMQNVQSVEFWGVLQDMSGILTGAASTVLGTSALYVGDVYTGGMLIASGIGSIANIALKYTCGWDAIAGAIAGENQQAKEAIKTYMPAALGITTAALGIYGSYQVWTMPELSSAQHSAAIAEAITNVLSGLTSMGNGVAQYRYQRTEANLSALQSISEIFKLDLDADVEDLKEFHKHQNEVQKTIAQLIEIANEAVQMIQQPV